MDEKSETAMEDIKGVIKDVQQELLMNNDWVDVYSGHAEKVSSNIAAIKELKKKFHEWEPLFLYMPVGKAKMKKKEFSVRYQGQEVGKLIDEKTFNLDVSKNKVANKKYFGYEVDWKDDKTDWLSNEAREFVKFFKKNPKRINIGKDNEEHRIESMLLSEFEKKESKEKSFIGIQPVKMADIARFQMPTRIRASKTKKENSTTAKGGGIDILAHIKGHLGIMELKANDDENSESVMKQCIAYATFIQALLRSKSGQLWWKIFNFNSPLPEKLELYAVIVTPPPRKDEASIFTGQVIPIDDKDSIHLHYMYYEESNEKIKINMTSL